MRAQDPKGPWDCVVAGVSDACNFIKPIKLLYNNQEVRQNAGNCFVLNGWLFMGSLVFYNLLLRPSIQFVLVYTWNANEREQNRLLSDASLVAVEKALWVVFNVAWVFPLFFLAKVLNSLYYQKVANISFRVFRGEALAGYDKIRQQDIVGWLSLNVADLIYSFIMQTIMVIEIAFLPHAPFGPVLSFIFSCWITSLYCFEYGWINAGWSLNKRIKFFERHWAYFFGFGFPFTIITFFWEFFVSTAVFSMLFPLYVIMATANNPIPTSKELSLYRWAPESVPICSPARQITNRLVRLLGTAPATSSPSPVPAASRR
ncbi:hypothetical protein PTSG_02772 [Salpingoeca rosetta]|uniref:Etoposide-induced protein 2.4 n=1 Tax=Salpingoeca rosetta (strain ATCC 50818 / BSB-021) TaxID=946362 RepID=F2U398_SALR5|nr:uncharacterized protein PTSG_02772 [Salpingoeca rosetta]EGD82092.1 hypothetical protein PTSG_02772 [Salpingoeca rosetta]|eukprot:XP_004996275.1 hypothetical protein PTSG_02772 [Salpingoeca rosetta]